MNSKFIFSLVFILHLLLIQLMGQAKHSKVKSNKNYKCKVDVIGNIYLFSNSEIIKHETPTYNLIKFSNKQQGNIDYIDVTNPMRILVYYQNFQKIIFLDNKLTETGPAFSIDNLGLVQITMVCSSMINNGVWLYDNQNNCLIRLENNIQPQINTGNLKLLLDADITPNFMMEHNSNLYMNCPNIGIMVFDIYGTYIKTIPLKNLTEFDIKNNVITYFQNQKLNTFNLTTLEEGNIHYMDSMILNNVIIQNNKQFKIYPDSIIKNEFNLSKELK